MFHNNTFPGKKIRAWRLPLAAFLLLASSWSQTGSNASSASSEDLVPFLNQSVIWYRQLNAQQQLVSEPSDVLFLSDNRRIADQIVRLSFDFARARAQAQAQAGQAPPASTDNASAASRYQRLADAAARADQQVKQSQQQLDGMRQKLGSVTGSKRRTLQAAIAEAESELELFEARRDVMRNMLQFTSSSTATASSGTGALSAQIEELARTVPITAEPAKEATGAPAASPSSSNSAVAAALGAQEHRTAPSGLLGLISEMFALRRKVSSLDDNLRLTESLADSAKQFRSPLVAKIRELTQRGDQLAAQPDSNDPAVLAQQRKDLDALTAQYKQLSASLLPLGKQSILLELYKRSVGNWRNAVETQYESELKGLLLRAASLGVILAIVIGISELWRRATFRYVTEPRRRSQFMLLRRIVVWSMMAIIIAIAFASELGAITTFAGLLTIGITVALQNVILSVAGYFFLIGKYGVRVGDRVQVAGITGDVVDVGLVRLHLMEVTGGASPRPTGRVAVFSNSVVFQANSGLFKQIPGTNFLWHEITLTLGAESNYRQVEERLLDAVNKVFAEYQETMERQRRSLERSLHSVRIGSFAPESRLRLTPAGLEVVIRYPVELGDAADTDDRITRELMEAIRREPKLRLLGAKIETQTA
jgi:small-conductance mechanosensitive channel